MKSIFKLLLGFSITNLTYSNSVLNLYKSPRNKYIEIFGYQKDYWRQSIEQTKYSKSMFNCKENRSLISQSIFNTKVSSNFNNCNLDSNIHPYYVSDTFENGIIETVDIRASFLGGQEKFIEYVTNTFQYPIRCQDDDINGFVILKFMVDEIGRISRVSAIEETPNCPEFTTEAIRVLKKSPQWIPGQLNGVPVKSWNEITIKLNVSNRKKRKKMR
jgi:protein TonB